MARALVQALSLGLVLAACTQGGGTKPSTNVRKQRTAPSCESVAHNTAALLQAEWGGPTYHRSEQLQKSYRSLELALIERCRIDRWDAAFLACSAAAKELHVLASCKLTPPQQTAVNEATATLLADIQDTEVRQGLGARCLGASEHLGTLMRNELTRAHPGVQSATKTRIAIQLTATMTRRCLIDNWPREVTACLIRATNSDALTACKLEPPQEASLSADVTALMPTISKALEERTNEPHPVPPPTPGPTAPPTPKP